MSRLRCSAHLSVSVLPFSVYSCVPGSRAVTHRGRGAGGDPAAPAAASTHPCRRRSRQSPAHPAGRLAADRQFPPISPSPVQSSRGRSSARSGLVRGHSDCRREGVDGAAGAAVSRCPSSVDRYTATGPGESAARAVVTQPAPPSGPPRRSRPRRAASDLGNSKDAPRADRLLVRAEREGSRGRPDGAQPPPAPVEPTPGPGGSDEYHRQSLS